MFSPSSIVGLEGSQSGFHPAARILHPDLFRGLGGLDPLGAARVKECQLGRKAVVNRGPLIGDRPAATADPVARVGLGNESRIGDCHILEKSEQKGH